MGPLRVSFFMLRNTLYSDFVRQIPGDWNNTGNIVVVMFQKVGVDVADTLFLEQNRTHSSLYVPKSERRHGRKSEIGTIQAV